MTPEQITRNVSITMKETQKSCAELAMKLSQMDRIKNMTGPEALEFYATTMMVMAKS
jgi:hypothetical protein